jgi:hypothetical protein
MTRERSVSVFVLVLLALSACSRNKDTQACDCLYDLLLPTPIKIVRKGSGLTPVSYSFTIDLSTGFTEFQRQNKIDPTDACSGSQVITDGLEDWEKSSIITVCTKELKNAISDGFLDSMTLYYPASQVLPEGIEFEKTGEVTTVDIQESFVDSILGRQQFDCSGAFAVDTIIKERFSCLSIE